VQDLRSLAGHIAPGGRLPYNRAMPEHDGREERVLDGSGERWLAATAAAACALLFLLLAYPILRGNIYQAGDLGSQQFPYRAFYSYCLQNGFGFLWWPGEFCGYYLHAEGQGAFFHPFQWLLYRFLALPTAFNVEFLASHLFLYGGMVALLRRWRLPWYAALFGANLFTFSGFVLYHFTHIQAITVTAHLPWVILALHTLLTAAGRTQFRRAWLALVALTASQLLSGYPQYVLFTLMAAGLYLALTPARGGTRRHLLPVAAAFLLGLMVAGVQVVPSFDLIQYAQRSGAAEFWKDGSLHPLNLLQWAGPYWFARGNAYGDPFWEYALYTGAIPAVLALWCALRFCGRGTWHPAVPFALLLVAAALVLSLGEFGGVYRFIAALPVLGAFRCPARHIMLVHFATAILAAWALARLGRAPIGLRDRPALAGIALAAWLTLPLALWLRPHFEGAFAENWGALLVGPGLISIAAALVYGAKFRPAWAMAALVAFAAADGASYTMPFVWKHQPQSTGHTHLREALARELPDDPLFIPYTGEYRAHGNWRVGRLSQLGLSSYLGYVGLPPAWVLDPDGATAKRVAGVRWEKDPFSSPAWTLHADALPLARLVAHTVVSDKPREAIEAIDVATTAIVPEPLPVSGGAPGTLTWIRNEPGRAAWHSDTPTDQLLVFAQRHHPGWRVTVDGEARDLIRVNGDFMGCVVPAGEHTVTFTFSPASFRYGLGLSGLGLFLTLGLWAALGRSRLLSGPDLP